MIRAWRIFALVVWGVLGVLAALVGVLLVLGIPAATARLGPRLMRAFSRGVCRILGVRVETVGRTPDTGPCFVAPNHWSYVDIFVMASLVPCHFVSRADVQDLPVIGRLVRAGGTIFIRRDLRRDAARVVGEIKDRFRRGFRVTAFLEGGTGVTVRRFRSPLLQAAADAGVPCVPVAIRYRLPDDPDLDPLEVVAWTETAFLAHVRRLLCVRRIEARVEFLPPRTGTNRKELARLVEQDVRAAVA